MSVGTSRNQHRRRVALRLASTARIIALVGIFAAGMLKSTTVRPFNPMAHVRVTPVPAAPAAREPQIYTEWVRRDESAGFILVYGGCTPARNDFFQPDPALRALPAAPRAELVSMPVRRATLIED